MSVTFVLMGQLSKTVKHHLASVNANYDCVVIGGGVRLPPQSLADFEAVVNAVHRAAPAAARRQRRRRRATVGRLTGKLLTKDEARRIAANFARLPQLLLGF